MNTEQKKLLIRDMEETIRLNEGLPGWAQERIRGWVEQLRERVK